MPRIAFRDLASAEWAAGENYLFNLFTAVRKVGKDDVQLILLSYSDTPRGAREEEKPFDQVLIIPDPSQAQYFRLSYRAIDKIKQAVGLENDLSARLRKHKVDALFTSLNGLGTNFRLPSLLWMPDFQSLYLPENFTEQEKLGIRTLLHTEGGKATRLIVSSNATFHHLEQHFPNLANKARILRFATVIPERVFRDDPSLVCAMYHLPERFIYLPNQFWKHKNHEAVVNALAKRIGTRPEITIVCTGNTNDYRDRLFFSRLLADISHQGVRNHFILLGMIPHDHVYALMRQSIAVLQPSLFEGWSTTVEEVKSLGKKIILSDLAVHHEQNPPGATYFNPAKPSELADILQDAFARGIPGPDLEMEKNSRQAAEKRLLEFGRQFMGIVDEIL